MMIFKLQYAKYLLIILMVLYGISDLVALTNHILLNCDDAWEYETAAQFRGTPCDSQ